VRVVATLETNSNIDMWMGMQNRTYRSQRLHFKAQDNRSMVAVWGLDICSVVVLFERIFTIWKDCLEGRITTYFNLDDLERWFGQDDNGAGLEVIEIKYIQRVKRNQSDRTEQWCRVLVQACFCKPLV